LKRIVFINQRSTAAKVTAELNIHLEDKSNIHGRAVNAKPLITENSAHR